MTRDEYFQYKVKSLSKRAKSILETNNISVDTIGTFRFSDFWHLKNCGTKTIFELTDLQKEINFIIENPMVPLVMLDESILKEFPLSVDGKNALYIMGINDTKSLYDIVTNKFQHRFLTIIRGTKTFVELCNLYKYLAERYSEANIVLEKGGAELPTLKVIYDEYNISLKVREVLSHSGIYDLSSLLRAAKNPNLNFSSYNGVGKKKDTEIHCFFDALLREKIELYERVFSTNNPYIPKYLSLSSSILDEILDSIFKEQIITLSNQQKNTVLAFYNSFFDVISKDNELYVSRMDESDKILLQQFSDKFKTKTEKFYDMTEQELLSYKFHKEQELLLDNVLFEMSYLNKEESQFVCDFFWRENRLPMFFLLYQSLKYTQNRGVYIFSAMIGLWYEDPHTHNENFMDYRDGKNYDNIEKGQNIENLGEKLHITRFRVLDIYEKFRKSNYVAQLPFVDRNSWDAYPFLKYDSISFDDVDFDNLALLEHLPRDFSIFCRLCALIRKDFSVLRISRNRGGWLGSPSRGVIESLLYSELYSYVFQTRMSVFDFIGLIIYVEKQIKKSTICDKEIVLADLCSETRFWMEKTVKIDIIPQITEFAEKIIKDILHIQPIDGVVHINANKVNVKQFLYDYMKEKGQPVTIEELFTTYIEKYPDTDCTKPEQIRNFLSDRTLFVPMGRKSLYTLAGTTEFCGCLPDLVIHILTSSSSPLSRQEIFQKAVELRPDSKYASIRTTITTLLKEKKVVLLENGLIELNN